MSSSKKRTQTVAARTVVFAIGWWGGEFAAAMEDVLDLYKEEYDPQYPTVCLDEKSVVLHADVQPSLPVEPGKPERVDYKYERRGMRNLFVMVEP